MTIITNTSPTAINGNGELPVVGSVGPVAGVIVAVAWAAAMPSNGVRVARGIGVSVAAGWDVAVGAVAVGICEKVAVTDLLAFITMVPGFTAPPKSPDQPLNCQPAAGDAVSCTEEPETNCD